MHTFLPIEKSPDGHPVVSARMLFDYFDVHADFSAWFACHIGKYDLQEKRDFWSILPENTGNHQTSDLFISLHVAKHLSVIEHSTAGQDAHDYFVACENQLGYAGQVGLQQQNSPRVAFFKSVNMSACPMSMTDAAEALKSSGMFGFSEIGRNKLLDLLKKNGMLDANKRPHTYYLDNGDFTVSSFRYGRNTTHTPRVTGMGLKRIFHLYHESP